MRKGSGEIKKLSDLFEKYRNTLKAPQKTVVSAFCEVVEDVLGVTVDQKKVSYTPHNRTLTLSVGGPLKSEILLHKEEILTHLKGRLGEQGAPKEMF